MSLAVTRLTASTAALLLAASTLTPSITPAHAAAPLVVTRVASGLTLPWDVTWVGNVMLFNERPGRLWSLRTGGSPQRVKLPLPRLRTSSEAGLLGMVAHPDAARNKLFYTCMSVVKGKKLDVQVWRWRLNSPTQAVKNKVILTGIPGGTGRHNGCRLRFGSPHLLYIATGDAAIGTAPQNLKSLGGKVLRVYPDGRAPADNPFFGKGGKAKYVWTYGHRNLQGLALRPGSGQIWSAEHGSDRDDEVNRILRGRNYGWSPTPPGYNESWPMTDLRRFPKAKRAQWHSGYPTVATSGATFLSGKQWRSWNGRLAVAMLKGRGILLFKVSRSGTLSTPARIATGYGRIRTVQQGPDGALYFTTSDGNAADKVYRLTLAG